MRMKCLEVYLEKQWMALLGYNYKAVDANLELLYLENHTVTSSGTQFGHKHIQNTFEISQSVCKLAHIVS